MASEAWLKRQALNIVAQLPEEPEDALAVLAYAVELVSGFMKPRKVPEKRQGAVFLSVVGRDSPS